MQSSNLVRLISLQWSKKKVSVYLPKTELVLLVLVFHPYPALSLRAIKVTAGASIPLVHFREDRKIVSLL